MKRILISVVFMCIILLSACGDSSIGVIGGADGPTAVFVAKPDRTEDDWGLALSAVGITDTGMTVRFEQSGGELIGELSTGSWYRLETYVEGTWRKLDTLVDDSVWTAIGYPINKNDITQHNINWEKLYGKLTPGHYRLCKEILNVRSPGDFDEKIYHVEFTLPTDADKANNAMVLSDVFVFDKEEIEKIEVIFPGEGDPYGCYVDKDEFFDIADTVKLEPERRIDEIDSNDGVVIIAVNDADERVSVWLDKRGRIGCSQFESSSAVTTQYDISRDDYIKLYSFLPEEATAHIPLENPAKKYIWIVAAVAVVIFGLGFVVGLRLNRQEH